VGVKVWLVKKRQPFFLYIAKNLEAMIKISIITVFPELHEKFVSTSLIQRAVERNLVQFNFLRLSDQCQPKERIDEPTVGHGAGMIVKPEVIQKAIELCQEKWGLGFKIFFSPQGQRLDQHKLSKIYKQLITGSQKAADSQPPPSSAWFDTPAARPECAQSACIERSAGTHHERLVFGSLISRS